MPETKKRTSKSLSEALIFALTNPQYDDIFVHWITSSIHENSKLKPGENRNYFWHSGQFRYTTCSPHVLQKKRASDKDLPVKPRNICDHEFWNHKMQGFPL